MDETEDARRRMVQEINDWSAKTREAAEAKYGKPIYDTEELRENFEVRGFLAPFVVVVRKSDGKLGSLLFQDHPRFYYGWEEHK